MVESNCRISKIQTETLLGLANYLSVSQIAQYRKKSRQSVYKTINQLIRKNLAEKIGMAYRLTEKGRIGLHSLIGLSGLIRQHNLAIKVEVLESHKNWDKIRSRIMQVPYFNKKVELNNNFYNLLSLGTSKIKITSKSVIFYLPSVYGKSVEECVLQMLDILYNLISKIEHRFKIRLIKDNKINIQIISQEYARLNDALAKLYRKEGNKLYISDEQGKVWLIADYSFKTDELETISVERADEDMTIVSKFMNDLRKNPVTMSEMKELMQGFSLNLVKHFEVLDKIGNAVTELKDEVKKLKNVRRI